MRRSRLHVMTYVPSFMTLFQNCAIVFPLYYSRYLFLYKRRMRYFPRNMRAPFRDRHRIGGARPPRFWEKRKTISRNCLSPSPTMLTRKRSKGRRDGILAANELGFNLVSRSIFVFSSCDVIHIIHNPIILAYN